MDTTYTYSISYNDPKNPRPYESGLSAGSDDFHRSIEELSKDIEYYKNLGYRITEIDFRSVCKTCNGRGTLHIPNKRNKFIGKTIRCPDCRGKNSETIIIHSENKDGTHSRYC